MLAKNKWSIYFLLAILSIPLFLLNVRDVHLWGDDYSQYIKEGQNFASGLPYYQSTYVYNNLNHEFGPPSYPPGFPLMLAPIIKVFGITIRPMLYLIAACLAGLLFAMYALFRRYMGPLSAICLASAGVYSGYIIDLKSNILADIPLTLFVTLYLLYRDESRTTIKRLVLLLFLVVSAMLIRSQTIVLLLAEGVFFVYTLLHKYFTKKSLSFKDLTGSLSLRILLPGSLLYLFCIKIVFPNPLDSWGFYFQLFALNKGKWSSVIAFNFGYLIDLLKSMVHFLAHGSFRRGIVTIMEYTGLIFSLLGFLYSIRRKITFEDVFFILMCAMIIGLSVYQGVRYILPILPIFLLYCYRTARLVLPRVLLVNNTAITIGVMAIYLFAGLDEYRKAAAPDDLYWTPYSKEDSLAFKYIRSNINDTEIIAFSKPRALALYTGKKAMTMGQVSATDNKKRFDSLHVRYMLIKTDVEDSAFKKYISLLHPAIDSLPIAKNYTLYKFY